jgi:AraC-like DNA-binding protein
LRSGGISLFLFGPALYCYVRAAIEADFRLQWRHLVHALPFLLILADRLHLFAPLTTTGATVFLSRPGPLAVLYYLQVIAYLLASCWLLYGFHQRIAENYSSLEGIRVRWLATLTTIALLLACLGLAFSLGRWLFQAISWPQRLWSIGMMITINYLIAFFAIARPSLYNPSAEERRPPGPAPARYQTSSLTREQAEVIWQRLEKLMVGEQPYLQHQLKIGELAQALDIPVSHLSQTINQLGDCSFFVYVNRYRVSAARELLRGTAPGARTMLDIALATGFNSESAFYKQFRKQVGVTPRQYQLEN